MCPFYMLVKQKKTIQPIESSSVHAYVHFRNTPMDTFEIRTSLNFYKKSVFSYLIALVISEKIVWIFSESLPPLQKYFFYKVTLGV